MKRVGPAGLTFNRQIHDRVVLKSSAKILFRMKIQARLLLALIVFSAWSAVAQSKPEEVVFLSDGGLAHLYALCKGGSARLSVTAFCWRGE